MGNGKDCSGTHFSALVHTNTVFGRLELEWCERKTLLTGWWLEAGAGGIGKGFTVSLEAEPDHGESPKATVTLQQKSPFLFVPMQEKAVLSRT